MRVFGGFFYVAVLSCGDRGGVVFRVSREVGRVRRFVL